MILSNVSLQRWPQTDSSSIDPIAIETVDDTPPKTAYSLHCQNFGALDHITNHNIIATMSRSKIVRNSVMSLYVSLYIGYKGKQLQP